MSIQEKEVHHVHSLGPMLVGILHVVLMFCVLGEFWESYWPFSERLGGPSGVLAQSLCRCRKQESAELNLPILDALDGCLAELGL